MLSEDLKSILKSGTGKIKDYITKAKEWFNKKIKKTVKSKTEMSEKDLDNPDRKVENIVPGRMYHFYYDPKWKKVLPYYDKFPLIFPIEFYGDGFLGINFHYLHPKERAFLLDALLSTLNNKKYDETTKIKISYAILNSSKKYKWFRPCIKRYLTSHIRSKFIEVYPDEWSMAIFLNTAKFRKASKHEVWNYSKKLY